MQLSQGWREARASLATLRGYVAVAPAAVAVGVGTVALLRMGAGMTYERPQDGLLWIVELAAALTAALFGGLLVHRSRGSAVGWLLQVGALGLALSSLAADVGADIWQPFGTATGSVQLWANLLGRVILLAAAIVAIPDRAAPGRAGSGPGTAVAAALVVGITGGLLLRGETQGLSGTKLGFGNRAWVDAAANVPVWVFVLLLVVHASAMVFLARQRRGDPTLFQIVGWGLAALALPVAFPALAEHLPGMSADVLAALTIPALPVVSVLAFLRALSWTVSRLVTRSIVWALLSVGVLLAQGVAVAVASLAGGQVGFVVSVVAGVAVAAGFQGSRARLQGGVDRLVYGVRRDPTAALSDLGRRMAQSLGPDDLMPDLAGAIAAAFGGGVVVELTTPGGMREVARAGSFADGDAQHTWPLVHQGERIGSLEVHPPAGAPFRPVDLAALGQLAAQAAVVAHSVRVSLELRRSQEELVAAVEDERRRLQRDLHDGLGPTLAGIALGLRAARNRLTGDQPESQPLLDRLTEEVEASVEEVRRIVHGLRPAVLDQLGLVAAVRAYAERCSSAELHVSLEVDGDLPVLPAATEVAAYRIAVEAITNVLRHANARHCVVRLRAGDELVVEVVDDGVGLADEITPGVGLASMRERSTGVGGRLLVTVGAGGGTRVVASLPMEARGA